MTFREIPRTSVKKPVVRRLNGSLKEHKKRNYTQRWARKIPKQLTCEEWWSKFLVLYSKKKEGEKQNWPNLLNAFVSSNLIKEISTNPEALSATT